MKECCVGSNNSTEKVRQWREFVNFGINKTTLISFLATIWKTDEFRSELNEKVIYVTSAEKCFKVTRWYSQQVEDLQCSQEEVDDHMYSMCHIPCVHT